MTGGLQQSTSDILYTVGHLGLLLWKCTNRCRLR